MDVTLLNTHALKIKGKRSTLAVDYMEKKENVEFHAQLLLKDLTNTDIKTNSDVPVIQGPGEYEISGTKITVIRKGNSLFYEMYIDTIPVLLTTTEALSTVKEEMDEYKLVILYANTMLEQSTLTRLQPSLIACYGEYANDIVDLLTKGSGEEGSTPEIKPVEKFSTTLEKLSGAMQVILLA